MDGMDKRNRRQQTTCRWGKSLFPRRKGAEPNGEIVETPYIADNNSIAGYILVLAENLDQATMIAKKCPILNGQNTSVEIRETGTPG